MNHIIEEIETIYQKKIDNLNVHHWIYVSSHIKLNPDFINRYKDKVIWSMICISQDLTAEVIRDNVDRIEWNEFSIHQDLTDEITEEFGDKIQWKAVSLSYPADYAFIMKHLDKLNLTLLSNNTKLMLTKEERRNLNTIYSLKKSF